MFKTEPRAGPQRPQPELSARQGDRRLIGDQRHGLHARTGRRLRPLAPARPARLVVGRRAALFQKARRSISWARANITRSAANGAWNFRACAGTSSTPGARRPTQYGIPTVDDFNTGDNEGSCYFHVNQKRGRRWSAARGFLKPVLNRKNLRLETGCLVEGSDFDGKRATGVRWRQNGATRTARCRGEVILAAGSIGSPQIMMLSGVGPAADLAQARHSGRCSTDRASAPICTTICNCG